MIAKLIMPVIMMAVCMLGACSPQTISTCSECEFVEYEYTETLSIISGYDTTAILVEQPYSDWELHDSIGTPVISSSDRQAPDSTVHLRFTVEAGAGSEEARAFHEVGYDGDKFRVWYGSGSRSDFRGKSKAASGTPRPPYFRIKEIEVQTPYQKEAMIKFNVRFSS